jgi:hypothetical protein
MECCNLLKRSAVEAYVQGTKEVLDRLVYHQIYRYQYLIDQDQSTRSRVRDLMNVESLQV